MKQNEKFLKESVDLLNREFGQPLPTLKSVMEKHQNGLLETPAAIAAAAKTAVLHSPKGGDVKVSTALNNKEHPLHKQALNWVKKKLKSKKKGEPKKQSKADADFYRRQYENLTEAVKKLKINSDFGEFEIRHGEPTTGPGYDRQYFVDVYYNNQYLGHFSLEGDPKKKGGKAKVEIHKGLKQVRIK